ncbi:MarR family winged helix-turn-helix transcriptional regulator [Saccharopolyspora shandongensis]|uniref:MarR family winged helix-turn-helix transcriptional regulator n=1 Tax=Saccharopolyspora shandongensis TaxID=418495 RepID=UPI0033F34CED
MPPHTRDPLALEEQVCFALAVASRSVVAAYKPVLEPLGLTHPQYLVMLALWQHGEVGIKDLSELLHLDPGTLSPLVKRLEHLGLLERVRPSHDQRTLQINLTPAGRSLKRKALQVPAAMLNKFGMTVEDLERTNALLHDIIEAAQTAANP